MSGANGTASASLTDAGAATAFLRLLYGEDATGWLPIWTAQGRATHWLPAANLDGAGQLAAQLADHSDVYFGIGLHPNALGSDQRGTADDVSAIPGLWADVDVLSAAHTSPNLPPTLDAALEVIAEMPLGPTLIVDSGHGLQSWWTFKEPWVFESDDERQEARALAERFQATLRTKLAAHGWHLDSTHDLARVLRLPGTVNRKLKPAPVRVLEFHPDRLYNPSDFETWLVALPSSNGHVVMPLKVAPPLPDLLPDGTRTETLVSLAGSLRRRGGTVDEIDAALQAINASRGDPPLDARKVRRIAESIGTRYQPAGDADDTRRRLDVAEGDLAALVGSIWSVLEASNEPDPWLYRRGGLPVRVADDDAGHPLVQTIEAAALRLAIARLAYCYRTVSLGRGASAEVPAKLALDVAEAALAVDRLPLPVLDRVVEAPVFGADWALCATPGYHPSARIVYRPPLGFTLPALPEVPSGEDLGEAKRLILEECLGEFPFAEPADRANAVGLALLPGIRPAIPGPTPLHGIDSPTPGTGKGLLVAAALEVWSDTPGVIGAVRDDDELRKSITARLMEGRSAIWLDKPTHALTSPVLAAALTADTWSDRVLGHSRTVALPVRVVWAVSGNNLIVSTENARRTVPIRLDARVDRPWEREGFRHPALLSWVREERARLVWACAVLVRHWLATGRKPGAVRLGSFEEWSATVGGILDAAGIAGFLGNRRRLYEISDEEGAKLRALVAAWWDTFHSEPVKVADLWPLWCEVEGIQAADDKGKADRSGRVKFGKLVGAQRDRVIGGYRVEHAGVEHQANRWRLAPGGKVGKMGKVAVPSAGNIVLPEVVPEPSPTFPPSPASVDSGPEAWEGDVPEGEELG